MDSGELTGEELLARMQAMVEGEFRVLPIRPRFDDAVQEGCLGWLTCQRGGGDSGACADAARKSIQNFLNIRPLRRLPEFPDKIGLPKSHPGFDRLHGRDPRDFANADGDNLMVDPKAVDPSSVAIWGEELAAARSARSKLSGRERVAVEFVAERGGRFVGLADVLGTSDKTAAKLYRRAIAKARSAMPKGVGA